MVQESKKNKIVIASVLKPADDIRMCEKMGKSLAETGNFDLHCIGAGTAPAPEIPHLTLHFLPPGQRLSLKRALQPWRVFKIAFTLKPNLFIIATHELLWVGMLLKVLTGCKLVYDVQENYYRNILYTPAFPKPLRFWLASYVRLKEKLCAPFTDYFILAEQAYQQELTFLKNRYIVIENKVKQPVSQPLKKQRDNRLELIFTGTLAETTGVFHAIHLAKELYKANTSIRLHLIGYCPRAATLKRITDEIALHSFITLTGGASIIQHTVILEAIRQATAGIIAYPPNHATANRIPTKLFEYLGYQLPILIVDHTPWVERCAPYNACVTVNFNTPDPTAILHHLQTCHFYVAPPKDVFWEEESSNLIYCISTLLEYDHRDEQ